MRDERQMAAEMDAKKGCKEWLHAQLEELAGLDFTDEELEEGLQTYLKKTRKNVLELKQEDKENIYGDIWREYLERERLRDHLTEYLGIETEEQRETIGFVCAEKLSGRHKEQYDFLADERLADVQIAIVPDELWVKGSQPSESDAENNLILFKESAFKGEDAIAWLTHELGHCQKLKDTDAEQYRNDSEAGYPDNEVERHAFTKQFEFLKSKGVTKEQILEMLKESYDAEELKFLGSLM